jgi:hypothetical protein
LVQVALAVGPILARSIDPPVARLFSLLRSSHCFGGFDIIDSFKKNYVLAAAGALNDNFRFPALDGNTQYNAVVKIGAAHIPDESHVILDP